MELSPSLLYDLLGEPGEIPSYPLDLIDRRGTTRIIFQYLLSTIANLYQKSFNDLVSIMTGADTLSGWDVLVSYDEHQINALLAERLSSIGDLNTLKWEKVTTLE